MSIVLHAIGQIEPEIMNFLRKELSKVFKTEVSFGQPLPEPGYAFNKQRNQYLSTAILRTILSERKTDARTKLLGIVDLDLYVPQLNFVFGEASRQAAVISLARLKQEFYGLPPDDDLFKKRVLTEAVHELGHTYGLSHCSNPYCVMFFSNTLADTDRKGFKFCPSCQKKLQMPNQ